LRVKLTNLLGADRHLQIQTDGATMQTRNMNARNYGLGSRDINKSAKNALKERNLSFSSVATISERFQIFSDFLIKNHNIKDLRWIDKPHVESFAYYMHGLVNAEKIAISTAQNYLSAVNTVMNQARQNKALSIKPSRFTGNRSAICTINKAFKYDNRSKLTQLHASPHNRDRYLATYDLCENFGLRIKEASLLNSKSALTQALELGRVHIHKGTKGGRARWIPIRTERQISALRQATIIQKNTRSLMPPNSNWKKWRKNLSTASKKTWGSGWHGGRHLYAQNLYKVLTGLEPPVVAKISHGSPHLQYLSEKLTISIKEARTIDREARLQVAQELGHDRVDVCNSYLG